MRRQKTKYKSNQQPAGEHETEIDMLTAVELEADPVVEAKLEALKRVHERKVRTLMSSVAKLQEELKKIKAESKEGNRSKQIQGLKTRIREQELTCDVLKSELCLRGRMSKEEVIDFVIKKTTGGPKRFRPKIREELQKELAELHKKHLRTEEQLKRAKQLLQEAKSSGAGDPNMPVPPMKTHCCLPGHRWRAYCYACSKDYCYACTIGAHQERNTPVLGQLDVCPYCAARPDATREAGDSVPPKPPGSSHEGREDSKQEAMTGKSPKELEEIGNILSDFEKLKVERSSMQVIIQMKQEENDELRERLREFGNLDEELKHKIHKYTSLKAQHEKIKKQWNDLVKENDKIEDDRTQLRAQLDYQEQQKQTEIANLTSINRGLEEDIENLLERERRTQEEMSRSKQNLTVTRNELKSKIKQLEKENNELKKVKKELEVQREKRQREWEKLFEENKSLLDQVKTLPSVRESLRGLNIESKHQQRIIMDTKKRLENTLSENKQLQEKLDEKEQQQKEDMKKNLALHGSLRETQTRVIHLESTIESLRATVEDKEFELEAAEARRQKVLDDHSVELENQNKAFRHRELDLKDDIKKEQAKTQQALKHVEARENDIKLREDKLKQLNEMNRNLKTKITAARVVQRKWEQGREEELQQGLHWMHEKHALETQTSEQQELIEDLKDQVHRLEVQMRTMMESGSDFRNTVGVNSDMESELKSAKQELNSLQQTNEDLQAEYNAHRNALSLLQQRNQELESHVLHLEGHLEQHGLL